MKKVIFVCHGNICRSPMAEFIAKYYDKSNQYEYISRAVSTEEYSNDIYYPCKVVLDKHHIPYTKHFAQKISLEEFKSAHIIFVMDQSNLRILKSIFLNEEMDKVKLLDDTDIFDPWYTREFDKAYLQIEKAVIKFIKDNKL